MLGQAERAGCSTLIAARIVECLLDHAALEFGDRKQEIARAAQGHLVAAFLEIPRKRVGHQLAIGRHSHDARDVGLQLSDIARPIALGEDSEEIPREVRRGAMLVDRELLDEVPGKGGDVRLAFTQRRHVDRKDTEAEEQILAEQPVTHSLRQVGVRRRDHPDVDRDRLARTDHRDFLALQYSKQLGLLIERHLTDLVQEQGATIGQLEHAPAPVHTGRGSTLDPEQLALEQVGTDRRAVDRDERFLGARAQPMKLLRHELLAGAALTREQHAHVLPSGDADHRLQLAHDGVRAQQVRVVGPHGGLTAERAILVDEALVHALDLLLSATLLDGHGHEMREPLEQAPVGIRERIGAPRIVEINGAHHAPPHEQRHGDHAPQTHVRHALRAE